MVGGVGGSEMVGLTALTVHGRSGRSGRSDQMTALTKAHDLTGPGRYDMVGAWSEMVGLTMV